MRLSILIPVYNSSVVELLEELSRQIDSAGTSKQTEIILIDDCSPEESIKEINRNSAIKSDTVTYIELDENIGRAKIRNRLAEMAKGTHLLFLDADLIPDSNEFLAVYLNCIEEGCDIVYGGRSYLKADAEKIRNSLAVRLDTVPLEKRKQAPWRHLLSANVLVRRDIFAATPFDERFTGYGYEDTEWALRLSKKAPIVHIDNTCSHLDIVTDSEIFDKMRSSTDNLLLLESIHPKQFRQTALSKVASCMERLSVGILTKFDSFICRCIRRSKPLIVSYMLFQFDKALLLAITRKTKQQLSLTFS